MANYKLLSGPFAGEIVPEGQVLDVPFAKLDADLQRRITHQGFTADDEGKDEYESGWDSEETDDDVTMRPLSEV